MYPVLCQIGPVTVYSYGLMLAVAVLVCVYFLRREAPARNLDPDVLADFVFWVVILGIAGARVFYIFLNLKFFINNPSEIVMLQHGGLAFQGGLISGFLTAVIFIRQKRLPVGKVLDTVAPYIALGHAIGRIGCFLNGCCYGRPVAWGIYFPSLQQHVHPTQLYESFALVALFFLLKKSFRVVKYEGQVFINYVKFAALIRFGNEFFRGDHGDPASGISIFQWVCLFLFAGAFYAEIILQRRQRVSR